jgi:antitoxin component YwqK of YwqJK toxin-antitoxin module
MELTLLYIYVGVFLTIFVVAKLVDRKSNPLKKTGFWLVQIISFTILTAGIFFLVLYALGGPRPKEGLNREYYPNGNLRNEFFIKDGKIDGISKYWYSNGQIEFYSKYRAGDHIDTSITYLENGQIRFLEIFENGKSIYDTHFYDNGQVKSETNNLINSSNINYRKDYYENGKLKLKIEISNSTFNGEGIYYDKNENIQYKGNYKDGQKNGIWYKLEPSTGQIIDQDTFYFNKPRQFKETWK